MSKAKAKAPIEVEEFKQKVFGLRFVISLLLIAAGIALIAYYYTTVRGDTTVVPAVEPGGPKALQDLGKWNYAIAFGAIGVGLWLAAHPSTPLGRGRGVVVGMLGCFLLGLVWICVFYVFAIQLTKVPVFNDLGQLNLAVGIGLMAIGFTYATRWE